MGIGQKLYRAFLKELKALYSEQREDGATSSEFYNAAMLLLEEFIAELEDNNVKFNWSDRFRIEVAELTDRLAEVNGENENDDFEDYEEEEEEEKGSVNGIPYLTPQLEKIAKELDLARPRGTIFFSLQDLLEYIEPISHLIYAIEILSGKRFRIWVVTNTH
jgi:hypothetical protein